MATVSQPKTWLSRNKMVFIVGVPLLCCTLAPFPIGCGLIYPITDTVRGHPQGRHGQQPQKLVGLWIRNETVMNDFLGQAFFLMPDGRLAGMSGLTETRWHFDDNRLFIDAVSRCGNCYRGNITTKHGIRFVGADQLVIRKIGKSTQMGVAGHYRRAEINDALKSEMSRMKDSASDEESYKARSVLRAIEHFETLSKAKP